MLFVRNTELNSRRSSRACRRQHDVFENSSRQGSALRGALDIESLHKRLQIQHWRRYWQIAVAIVDGVPINYVGIAEKIWGPINERDARNKLSSHLSHMRRLGVVSVIGHDMYRVDRARLVERSGLQIPVEGAP
jgi:hypothetical protein